MDIRNRKDLRREADAAVAANSGNPRQTLLVYLAVTLIGGLLITILGTILDGRIANTGGLQNLGQQAILSTIQTAAPLIWGIALMGLELGRQRICMRMIRRQSVEPRDLTAGFPKLGGLIRAGLLQGGLYLLLLILAVNLGTVIFMATPLPGNLYAIVADIALDSEALYEALYNDPEFLNQVFSAMLPAYPIVLVLFMIVATPVFYRYRMTNYCLLDSSRNGALAAMGESIRMTKGSRFALFKLDLSFWWFYLGQLVCAVVIYGDVLLEMMGVTLPWNSTVNYYVFYVVALVMEFVLYYITLNQVQTTYAAAYEALKPKAQAAQGGVVLGNIFDLAREQKGN